MEINMKDSNCNDLKIGDEVLFRGVFDHGEYSTESEDCVGKIVFVEGHTYFRFPFENKEGYSDELLGSDFDWDPSDCELITLKCYECSEAMSKEEWLTNSGLCNKCNLKLLDEL